MKDQITLDRIKLLHPKLREEAAEIYDEIYESLKGKARCRFTHTLRTFAEQDAIYQQGRTKPGPIVSQAKAGLSPHNYGLAIDIVLLVDKDGDGSFESAAWDSKTDFDKDGKSDWMEIVTIFKQHGWEWGGDWKFVDMPHFQKCFGKSVRELLALYNAKKVDANNYVPI
jgi:peptidoglycan L-alanyl-D-glutamate endopeptidase CwlK